MHSYTKWYVHESNQISLLSFFGPDRAQHSIVFESFWTNFPSTDSVTIRGDIRRRFCAMRKLPAQTVAPWFFTLHFCQPSSPNTSTLFQINCLNLLSCFVLFCFFFQATRSEDYWIRTRSRRPGFQYRGWSWESTRWPANLRQNCLPDWRCGPRWATQTRWSDYCCEWRESCWSRPWICCSYAKKDQRTNYSHSTFVSTKTRVTKWPSCF